MSKIGNLLKKAANKQPSKKKKDEKPKIETQDIKSEINDWLGAKKQSKNAIAEMNRIGSTLISRAEQELTKHVRANRKYTSTVKLDDGEGNTVSVSATNRYSPMSTESEEELREVYGDEYDKYFAEKTEINLKPEAINNEELLGKLIEAVGEEDFDRFFDVKQSIQTNDRYHEDRIMDPDLADKHQQAVNEGLVSCAKPSVKAGS